MNLNASKINIGPKLNYMDLIIFIIPVLVFSSYFFAYRPCVLTLASYSQLHQIVAGKFTVTYPIFHTFLVMLCLDITHKISSISIFQILIFSLIWTVICKYHRDDTKDDTFFKQFILTLIICIIPINAVYSITLSSNILFSYSILFLSFLIKIMVDKNGKIDIKLITALAATMAIMSGLNNYGILIALLVTATITYYLIKKHADESTLLTLISMIVIGMLFIGSLNVIYEVKGTDYDAYTATYSIPANDAFEDGVNLETARAQYYSILTDDPSEYESTTSANYGKINYNLVDSFVNLFRDNFILDALFNNPILYMVLSVVLLAFLYIRTESQSLFLIYVPNLINTAISLLTGQNNLYSNLLVFYLILIIFLSIYFNQKLKTNNLGNKTQKLEKQAPAIASPKVIPEQKQIENTDYYNLESELEKLTIDDINDIIGENRIPEEKQKTIEKKEPQNEYSSDLLDDILKEIEMGKK